ncbi:hypothetical protein [Acidovorax sp. 1608163]|uniref:hypothetical protein n=1 Tax=Acidovorax sp. 1608163 TaxID=2478662 RepID=UPI0013CEF433|nr:hypothetical protein [Acidovorax sp. 1608163]
MNFNEINLKGTFCLGSAEFPFTPGEHVDALFAQSGIVLQGKTRSARFSYFELAELEISGPGTVTTGGGFVGGGFGVEGALQGMGIATILNGLTTRSKIHTFITLITNFGELHLHYDKMEPSALRVVLASVFQRLRSCNPQWHQQRASVLELARASGKINDAEYSELLSRLSKPPAWPDPVAEEALRKQEAAERKRLADAQAPQGICPNCDTKISIYSEECPRCRASFGPGSAWSVKPLAA